MAILRYFLYRKIDPITANINAAIVPTNISFSIITSYLSRPMVCVTGAGASVDKVWMQEKTEARKNAAESQMSGA